VTVSESDLAKVDDYAAEVAGAALGIGTAKMAMSRRL